MNLISRKKIGYWILPEGFKELTSAYRKQKAINIPGLDPRELDKLLKRNLDLKNRHSGLRCFILLTGPSIANENLDPLANEITFACSRFFLHPSIEIIKPQYYVQPDWHDPIRESAFLQVLVSAYKTMPWVTAIMGAKNIPFIRNNDLFGGRVFYYYGGVSTGRLTRVSLDEPALKPQSVSVMALYCAIYMGFREIFLLGCDHDFILSRRECKHFYEEREGYYSADTEKDVHFKLTGWCNLWAQYRLLKEFASRKGSAIYNATENSELDVFPKVDFRKLV